MKVGTRFKIEFEVSSSTTCKPVGGSSDRSLPHSACPGDALYGATPLDIVEPPTVFELGDRVRGPAGEGIFLETSGGFHHYRVKGFEYEPNDEGVDCHMTYVGTGDLVKL